MDDFDVKVGRRYANRVVELDILPHLEESIVIIRFKRERVRATLRIAEVQTLNEVPLSNSRDSFILFRYERDKLSIH